MLYANVGFDIDIDTHATLTALGRALLTANSSCI